MTKILGLTGGIATGKSTVSRMFQDKDIPVIDTDSIAKQVLEKGTQGYNEVLEYFGEDILLTDKEINRKLLGRLIFMNKTKRDALNNIVHPKVLETCMKQIEEYKKQKLPLVVLDVPLLYETGIDKNTDFVCVIYTTKKRQLQRLMDRDLIDEEYASLKIKSQMTMEAKIIRADFVINNNHSILETKHQFNAMLKELGVN